MIIQISWSLRSVRSHDISLSHTSYLLPLPHNNSDLTISLDKSVTFKLFILFNKMHKSPAQIVSNVTHVKCWIFNYKWISSSCLPYFYTKHLQYPRVIQETRTIKNSYSSRCWKSLNLDDTLRLSYHLTPTYSNMSNQKIPISYAPL